MFMIDRFLFLFVAFVLSSSGIHAQVDKDHHFKVAKNLDVFNIIYKQLDLMYVDTLNADQTVGNGIRMMLRSLDPYTEYYSEKDLKDLKFMTTGKYAGIGALIKYHQLRKEVVIDEPYEGNPAVEAGLKKGDVILAIDNVSCKGKDVSFVSSHLRGDPGTSFVIQVFRPSTNKKMKMKITRRIIQNPAIPFYGMRENHIGYINLQSFTDGCSKDMRRAIVDLQRQGMKSLILDLRGNGGGSEQESVDIVNMFVPKGTMIVENRGKIKRANMEFRAKVEPIDSLMPIVVLVNNGTASAGEITSGALQDLDRAVVMGTRTYGKGLVQMTVNLPYNETLKLTTAKYYIPSGRCIQAVKYNRDGSAVANELVDSLKQTFYTLNGRKVYDGGGIMPDVKVENDSVPSIIYYLISGRDSTEVIFDYVSEYVKSHPTIAKPGDFELSDADYEAFKKHVVGKGFTYGRDSEKYLQELLKLVKFEGYYEDTKEDFEHLQQKLSHNIEKDLEYNKSMIKQVLESDIITAYYYQRGAVENSLKSDKQVQAAVDLLNDLERYHSILRPVKKVEK